MTDGGQEVTCRQVMSDYDEDGERERVKTSGAVVPIQRRGKRSNVADVIMECQLQTKI